MNKSKKSGRGKAVRNAIRQLNRLVDRNARMRSVRRANDRLEKRVKAVDAARQDAKRQKK